MDGTRIRDFMENEAEAMLKVYSQFQILIPADGREGAAHPGEDGMYVEALLKSYIQKFLPSGLEALTGFILRPAVKTGSGKRKGQVIRTVILPSWILLYMIRPTFLYFSEWEIM